MQAPLFFSLAHGNAVRKNSAAAQHRGNSGECAVVGEAHPQVAVLAIIELPPISAGGVVGCRPEHDGWMGRRPIHQITLAQRCRGLCDPIPRGGTALSSAFHEQRFPSGATKFGPARHQHNFRMRSQNCLLARQPIWGHDIARIHAGDVNALRRSTPRDQRAGQPRIRLGQHTQPRIPAGIFREDFSHARIGGAIVDDYQLEVAFRLRQYAVQGGRQHCGLVEHPHDHGNGRRTHDASTSRQAFTARSNCAC